MKTAFLSLVLALGPLAFAGSDAHAQVIYSPYYGYGYNPYSAYYYAPSYYVPPYYWSGRYYVGPYTRSYYYGAYSPYTNTYFYNYRVRPRWWWRY
jgi:hypothetical protein